MKRALATLLCIAMMLSLVACGGGEGSFAAPKGEPTEEDLAAIGYYERAMNQLSEYAETGRIAFHYADFGMEAAEESVNGQKALAAYYELLTNLDAVDQWVGSEHITNTDINWDRQAVLDSFVVVENVLADGTYTENRPESNPYVVSMAGMIQYDENGKVLDFSSAIYSDDIWDVTYDPSVYTRDANGSWKPEYDKDGRISALVNSYVDNSSGELVICATRTFTYDASGNRVKENLKTKHWDMDYTYSYDDANRLVQISWYEDPEKNLTIDYTYDASGKLIQTIEKTPQRDSDGNFTILNETTCEYTYGDGEQPIAKNEHIVHMEKGVTSLKDSQYPDWAVCWERTNNYSYTYDDAGRLQTKVLTYGDTYSYWGDSAGEVRSYSIETETYEYVFGNYYIYTPTN